MILAALAPFSLLLMRDLVVRRFILACISDLLAFHHHLSMITLVTVVFVVALAGRLRSLQLQKLRVLINISCVTSRTSVFIFAAARLPQRLVLRVQIPQLRAKFEITAGI